MKSYAKLSSALMLSGIGCVALERVAASGLSRAAMHLPAGSGWLLSGLAIVPLLLLAAGMVIYIGGAMLGLK